MTLDLASAGTKDCQDCKDRGITKPAEYILPGGTKVCRACYRVRMGMKREAATAVNRGPAVSEKKCECGRNSNHRGRCWARRGTSAPPSSPAQSRSALVVKREPPVTIPSRNLQWEVIDESALPTATARTDPQTLRLFEAVRALPAKKWLCVKIGDNAKANRVRGSVKSLARRYNARLSSRCVQGNLYLAPNRERR
jgi:hypothetical protein